jgi:AcrR family transcriptional regulator
MMSIKEEMAVLKRRRIIETSARLFSENGYTRTNLDSVAAELGVAKPFIYSMFKTKNDILDAICTSALDQAAVSVGEAAEEETGPEEKLSRMVIGMSHAIIDNRHAVQLFYREEKHLDEATIKRVLNRQNLLTAYFRKVLEDGRAQGLFQVDDIPLTVLSMGGMLTYIHRWYRPDGRMSREQLVNSLADIVLKMVK